MSTESELNLFTEPGLIVAWAKHNLGIDTPNGEMSDDEIRRVIKWICLDASIDTGKVDGKYYVYRKVSVSLMLSIVLLVFPEFYERYQLAQWN